jgi:hypothetical protein
MSMTVHVIAILALAVVCGLWMTLQLAGGEETPAASGRCGACAAKDECATESEANS